MNFTKECYVSQNLNKHTLGFQAMQLTLSDHPWLADTGAQTIMSLAKAAGGEVRFVGGCVRDALMQRPIGDLDMATNLPPDQLSAVLRKAGIKVVPTGIDHGTITAVIDKKPYEITTLRRDVSTDGRHAVVAFTDDWATDAARRDFTINALYVDAKGDVYDFVGGLEDLNAKHLRFIGAPCDRIAEDVLRLFRYFRFKATLAWPQQEGDQKALSACTEAADQIPTLSVERIWNEIKKLLAAPDPAAVWEMMRTGRVLAAFLPEAKQSDDLAKLIASEQLYGFAPDPLRRLAATGANTDAVLSRLHLSKREAAAIIQMRDSAPSFLEALSSPRSLHEEIYRHGAEAVQNRLLLQAHDQDPTQTRQALSEVASWTRPTFPLRGEDLLQMGFQSGPDIGHKLRQIEGWWINQDFAPNREDCLQQVTK